MVLAPPEIKTKIGETQECYSCGKIFGTDEAEKCNTCHSYICPYCSECLCARVKDIFTSPMLAFA